jgi:hypothetical protein
MTPRLRLWQGGRMDERRMHERRAVRAALLYCAILFGAGLMLGAIRTFCVAPLSGEFVAVTLEAPIMLAVAWAACGWVAKREELSEKFLDRLIMGGVSLAVLVAAEAAIAIFAERGALADYFLTSGQSGVLLGLLAQLAFALFPILRRQHGPAA